MVVLDIELYTISILTPSITCFAIMFQGIPGIEGIDTRALTKVIRQHGTMLGRIVIVGEDK